MCVSKFMRCYYATGIGPEATGGLLLIMKLYRVLGGTVKCVELGLVVSKISLCNY